MFKLSDEKKTFLWRLPGKDLMKSTTDMTIDRKKLCVINLFYTTNTMLIQRKNSKKKKNGSIMTITF